MLIGHVKKITCADFSPNGWELATGSDDHTVRIWDLRKKACGYTLPAHTALISDLRYDQVYFITDCISKALTRDIGSIRRNVVKCCIVLF